MCCCVVVVVIVVIVVVVVAVVEVVVFAAAILLSTTLLAQMSWTHSFRAQYHTWYATEENVQEAKNSNKRQLHG